MRLLAVAFLLLGATHAGAAQMGPVRPNILWFVVDDMSPNFSCYGETTIRTPHVDRLAREGTVFTSAFVSAPVCSPSRSALITGMYQTSIGAHQHRSGRGVEKIRLPDDVSLVPALFQRAGYYTCIGSGIPNANRAGKKTRGGAELGKASPRFTIHSAMSGGRIPYAMFCA